MKRVLALSAIGILVAFSAAATVHAAERPVQLALFTPIQVFPEGDDITLFRLNLIYGRNASVTGLDLGLVNHTTSGLSKALQLGFVGYAEGDFMGVQWNGVNAAMSDFKGLQYGVVNYARNARGLQLGLVNYTETMYGVQIGLVNVIRQGEFLPVFPFFNFSF